MPAPTIRGTGIQASSNSSYTVTWPSGTLAGDLAVILVGHGFGANTLSGWNAYQNLTGSNWNGAVFSKVLTSGDISTGSVTVTFAGSFDGTLAIITFVGSVNVKNVDASRNGSGSSSIGLTTSIGATPTTDLLVYFGSNRAASTNTVSRGTLQQQANDLSAASGCLYTETGASGVITATFNYSVAGIGNYQAIAIISPPPVPAASNITAPITVGPFGPRHQIVKASSSVTLTPSALSPVPVSVSIASGIVGITYSDTITTSGGTGPYTYSLVSGTLPTGTTLSSAGVISGIPTTAGTYSFSIRTTDSTGLTGTQAFQSVVINKPAVNYGYTA